MSLTHFRKEGARGAGLLLFLWFFLSGCAGVLTRPPGPWYDVYQPIQDSTSHAFVADALARAVNEFGEPAFPVQKVLLRRSRKIGEFQNYRVREDFSLTECEDVDSGLLVIYMGLGPEDPDYWAFLAHECAHLLNPRITDWYMEGIATLFSKEVCEEQGIVWNSLRSHFETDEKEPYALSYRMMQALKEAFPEEYPSIIRFVAPNRSGEEWLRIDIDAWIASLPAARQSEALSIIEPYAKRLVKEKRKFYDFKIPSGID
ncbi:MAG: hypothetical protein JXR40_00940 [Pontiellaceae bacterium]|nr:hypothetical protein [Pontiellaceae bacterium]